MSEIKIPYNRLTPKIYNDLTSRQFVYHSDNTIEILSLDKIGSKNNIIPDYVSDFYISNASGTKISFNKGSGITDTGEYVSIEGGVDIDINTPSLHFEKYTIPYIQPIMTSNTTPYGVCSASSYYSSSYLPYEAFNNTSSSYRWQSSSSDRTPWLQYDLNYPIIPEKFTLYNTLQGYSPISSKILGLNLEGDWEVLVDNVIGLESAIIHEIMLDSPTSKEYSAFRLACDYENNYISISMFGIFGNYSGYNVPNSIINLFMVKNNNKNELKLSLNDTLTGIPYRKIGYVKTDYTGNIIDFYPKRPFSEDFKHGKVLHHNNELGYRIYSDGWKVQWGTNANPVFPITFNETPRIIEKGATSVTQFGMTIGSGYWKVEGY